MPRSDPNHALRLARSAGPTPGDASSARTACSLGDYPPTDGPAVGKRVKCQRNSTTAGPVWSPNARLHGNVTVRPAQVRTPASRALARTPPRGPALFQDPSSRIFRHEEFLILSGPPTRNGKVLEGQGFEQ